MESQRRLSFLCFILSLQLSSSLFVSKILRGWTQASNETPEDHITYCALQFHLQWPSLASI